MGGGGQISSRVASSDEGRDRQCVCADGTGAESTRVGDEKGASSSRTAERREGQRGLKCARVAVAVARGGAGNVGRDRQERASKAAQAAGSELVGRTTRRAQRAKSTQTGEGERATDKRATPRRDVALATRARAPSSLSGRHRPSGPRPLLLSVSSSSLPLAGPLETALPRLLYALSWQQDLSSSSQSIRERTKGPRLTYSSQALRARRSFWRWAGQARRT